MDPNGPNPHIYEVIMGLLFIVLPFTLELRYYLGKHLSDYCLIISISEKFILTQENDVSNGKENNNNKIMKITKLL